MKKLVGLIGAAALAITAGCAQTDAGITTNVKSQLAADETVKAYQIDVDTSDHVVTLRGEVDSAAARERAVQIASTTNGVRDVVDQIVINEAAATSGDAEVGVGDILRQGAEDTGDALKEGAEKLKEGAEEAGEEIKEGVTDKDRDSDNDGR